MGKKLSIPITYSTILFYDNLGEVWFNPFGLFTYRPQKNALLGRYTKKKGERHGKNCLH